MKHQAQDQKKPLLRFRLPELSRWQSLLLQAVLILTLSAVILYLTIQMQPNKMSLMIEQFTTQPLLILLNYIPIFVIMIFFSALTGNVFYGASLTELLVGGFSVANRIKCSIRQEPVYPRDLQMLREVGEALNSYHIDFPMKIIAVVLLVTVFLALLGFVLPRMGLKPLGLKGLWRWIQCVGSALLAVVLVFTLFSSRALYTSFTGTSFFNPLGAYLDLGFPYSFCYYLTTNSVDKPAEFDEEEARQWDSEEIGDTVSKPVNVVIVMSETFSDLTDQDMFHYDKSNDPIPFYHEMIEREDVISGHLVVMDLGGGTANTEFDVMTGIQADSLSDATPVAFRTLDGNKDSIFRMYKDAGYNTSYIHPGHLWFYNRYHILPWFGADSTTFSEDLEDPEMLGSYVSDAYTTDLLIQQFEQDTANGSLAFNYTTTIQNHMNYTLDKYGEDYPIPELPCSAELDEETETALAVYAEGLRYADDSLEELVTYFESCGEPVLFVFFGDHLPYLGDNNSGYWQLGMEGDNKEYDFSLYEPPYLIWANEEAQQILDWDSVMKSLDMPERISACYLGGTILEITGMADSSPWYTYLNELRREYPVVWQDEYMDVEGNILYELPADDAEKISKWRNWSYYRLQCKKISD